MPHGWTRLVATSLVIGTTIAALGAQEPRRLTRPDSIPYDLAVALIGGSFGTEPEVMVGGAPGWAMQRLYVPPDSRVLGSSFLGTAVTTVIALPLGVDSATAQQVRSELMQRGWTEPPRPVYSYGGFRAAAVATLGMQSTTRFTLCNADYVLYGDVRRRGGVARYLVYRLTGGTTGVCHPPQPLTDRGMPRFPTLYEPDGTQDMRASQACYPQNAGSSGTDAFFHAPMSADRVLEHFARQLADSGWTRLGDTIAIARGEWTRSDSSGAPVRLTLTITVPPGVSDPQCHQAEMRVMTTRKP